VETCPIDEQTLIELARTGNRTAVEELVRLHQEFAFRVAFVVTRNDEDARDAAQIALYKAITAIRSFRSGAPFRPWLARIAANEARDVKSISYRHASVPLEESIALKRESPDPSPLAQAELAEERDLLLAAVNALRPDDRLIIAYRYFLGLSESEMATALDCPAGTVKSRLSRAIGRLREVLASEQFPVPGEKIRG
jgi:RNA polymerase sigma-70 factor (ECF subfamily)